MITSPDESGSTLRASSMPCIHAPTGECWLRRCWMRGCRQAEVKGLTKGTGKLAGDRLCQGLGGFCEYIRPCKDLCKKVIEQERAALDNRPTEDEIIKTWMDYGYDGMPH